MAAIPTKADYEAKVLAIRNTNVADIADPTTAVARRVVHPDQQNDKDHVVGLVPNVSKALVASKKRYLFGVSFPEVAAEALMSLAAARHFGSPVVLMQDMIFAVFVAYTVSRDWAVEYNNLHANSFLRKFEIDGRLVDKSDPMFNKNNWVNSSRMNSSAVHLFGYLLVDAAPVGGVLEQLKTLKGTPFSDKKLETAQGKLITELAKTLSQEDKDSAGAIKEQFDVLVHALDVIFGAVGIDLNRALARAAAYRPAEF